MDSAVFWELEKLFLPFILSYSVDYIMTNDIEN